MPVLDGHNITIHSLLPSTNGTQLKTEVNVSIDATVADVLEAVLDNFSISAGPEHYELQEVKCDKEGKFPDNIESIGDYSRTLNYAECPVAVINNRTDNVFVGDNSEYSNGVGELVKDVKTRLYIAQKSCPLEETSEFQIAWYDGIEKIKPEKWQFDPYYREKEEIDDLVNLPVLNEEVLLDELCVRFGRGRIYTYVGGILIAVNPFKYFPLYNPKYIKAYQHKKLGDLPPHIFAIADAGYSRMLRDKQDQCIVISGESGSGKTESTKLILHHLTALSHKTKASLLEKTILHAGPVLEAFGNAKTCHNNNSSRFGKFTQINYRADGVVCGAVLKKYLLEKSRIVSQASNERNYHVFYYLLYGASQEERESLHLESMSKYHYLNQTKCYTIDGIDEVYEFSRLKSSIKNIGLHHGMQQRMFSVLSAVLLIGNITFKKRTHIDDGTVIVADETILDTISTLLQVDKEELITPLTMRKTITRGEEFVRFYRNDEAVTTRDSMAKCLYASLFDWIVLQINHIIINRQGRKLDKKEHSIGVLDIFGFEDFTKNSFEQFCINLANENLQYYLNQHIFKMIQDEYTMESLNWKHIDYVDNTNCLNLIVGRPTGLILLLDEECSLTMGTDESLLDKFNKHHADNLNYEMPPMRKPVFSIRHYAGTVKYQIKGFRTKNRDLMRSDIVAAFKNSRMLFVRELMGSDPVAIYYWSILRHVIKGIVMFKKAGAARAKGEKMFDEKPKIAWVKAMTPPPTRTKMLMRQITLAESDSRNQAIMKRATKVMNRSRRVQELTKLMQSPSKVRSGLTMKRAISGGINELSKRGGLKSPPTVAAQFHSSLQELMETLNNSHPFFVRCIRSNAGKVPFKFDAELVQRQLRYTGMLETVKLRQAGYPCRVPIKDFLHQFKILLPFNLKIPTSEQLSKSLKELGIDPDKFQIGKTKVYLQDEQYNLLRNKGQEKIHKCAIVIQRWIITMLERKHFKRKQQAVLHFQRLWRGYSCRKQYMEFRKLPLRCYAASRIQACWREYKRRKLRTTDMDFVKFKHCIILFQARWRGYQACKRYTKMLVEKQEAEENKKIQENAELMVYEALKDTIFTKEDTDTDQLTDTRIGPRALSCIDPLTTSTDQIIETDKLLDNFDSLDSKDALVPQRPYHHYEEIDDLAAIFNNYSQETPPPPVKMRSHSGADRSPENMKQKLIRRLSLNAKDKVKNISGIKRVKEAEDDSFIHVSAPVEDLDKVELQKSNVSINYPPPQRPEKTSFANFFHALQRKGSKRDFNKVDKKSNRRNSAMVDENNEYIVNGEIELEAINLFLMRKVTEMNTSDYTTKPDADVDTIFKHALHKFHGNLLFTCGNNVQRHEPVCLKFNDLISAFQGVLDQMVSKDDKVPEEFSHIGGNLFRGIIEEFKTNKEKLILKRRQKKPIKRKRRKTAELYEHKRHIYQWQSFNINTYCEACNALIYERGLECQACTFTCHKRCYTKYNRSCKGRRPSVCGPAALYGTDLSEITSPNNPIPLAIIKLMLEIEKRGLHTVGLYRKPGLQAAVNNLKSVITTIDAEDLLLEDERPHTLASALKLFFRQLPKPLICMEFYEDFIRCTDLETEEEMHSTMYELIQRYPKANRELLERLIVHLSRVAMYEESNKMSPNALAIIWAPALMKPPGDSDTLDCLQRLPKQTKCIEVLIDIQVKSRRDMLHDIEALDKASCNYEKRLDIIKKERESLSGRDEIEDGFIHRKVESDTHSEEFEILQLEISNMDEERQRLTNRLGNIQPHKRESFDSLDELSETDTEDLVDEKKERKRNPKLMRDSEQFSSFEDLECEKDTVDFSEISKKRRSKHL